jgi:hypothetical protein
MKKTVCDRCGKGVDTGDDLVVWDQSWSTDGQGVVWSVRCKSNYMNGHIDVCGECQAFGVRLLEREATNFGPKKAG